jgi:hypothetical protein
VTPEEIPAGALPIAANRDCIFCWWGDPLVVNPTWRGGGYVGWHVGHDGAPLCPCLKIFWHTPKHRAGEVRDDQATVKISCAPPCHSKAR